MSGLKTHQPSMTIDEQIANLREKGLIIKDMELLFEKYPSVKLHLIGFPKEWQKYLQ